MTDTRPLALITGASSGIGFHLAEQFADHGFDLIVNAEDDELSSAADRLRALGAEVRDVRLDLRHPDAVPALHGVATADGRPLEAVALNAGVGLGGPFLDTDLDDELALIQLNVISTIHLAKLVLRDMARRDAGRLLITSSIASTMPGTYQSIYNASKSFLQSFAEALQEELDDTGITITSLMPGPTDTEFFVRAGMQDTRVGQGPKDDPAAVAEQGFAALMSGDDRVVAASLRTKAQEAMNKILPDSLKAAAHGRMAEPGSGDQA